MKKSRFLLIATLSCCLCLTACGGEPPSVTPGEVSPDGAGTVEIPAKPVVKYHCPYDNAPLTEMPLRPIVVTIDNLNKARPQAGLAEADLLYEIPAEGGISRFVAVFYHGEAFKVGPVRSARPYLVDIAREHNGVYVHVGGSSDALDYLSSGVCPDINQFSYGKYFWRDQKRKAPHNVYTTTDNLKEIMVSKKWNVSKEVKGFQFLPENQKNTGNPATTIHLDYLAAKNVYTYDADSNLYLRSIGEQPHVDQVSGEQLKVSNVLVQYVTSKVLDQDGRLAIDMTKGGKALLFSDGVVIEGTWSRKSVKDDTVFQDATGKELQLESGKTWIQVVDQTVKVSYE